MRYNPKAIRRYALAVSITLGLLLISDALAERRVDDLEKPPTVSVLRFEAPPERQNQVDSICDLVEMVLASEERLSVVDRSNLQSSFREAEDGMGATSLTNQVVIGAMLGADYFLRGTVVQGEDNKHFLWMSLTDTRNVAVQLQSAILLTADPVIVYAEEIADAVRKTLLARRPPDLAIAFGLLDNRSRIKGWSNYGKALRYLLIRGMSKNMDELVVERTSLSAALAERDLLEGGLTTQTALSRATTVPIRYMLTGHFTGQPLGDTVLIEVAIEIVDIVTQEHVGSLTARGTVRELDGLANILIDKILRELPHTGNIKEAVIDIQSEVKVARRRLRDFATRRYASEHEYDTGSWEDTSVVLLEQLNYLVPDDPYVQVSLATHYMGCELFRRENFRQTLLRNDSSMARAQMLLEKVAAQHGESPVGMYARCMLAPILWFEHSKHKHRALPHADWLVNIRNAAQDSAKMNYAQWVTNETSVVRLVKQESIAYQSQKLFDQLIEARPFSEKFAKADFRKILVPRVRLAMNWVGHPYADEKRVKDACGRALGMALDLACDGQDPEADLDRVRRYMEYVKQGFSCWDVDDGRALAILRCLTEKGTTSAKDVATILQPWIDSPSWQLYRPALELVVDLHDQDQAWTEASRWQQSLSDKWTRDHKPWDRYLNRLMTLQQRAGLHEAANQTQGELSQCRSYEDHYQAYKDRADGIFREGQNLDVLWDEWRHKLGMGLPNEGGNSYRLYWYLRCLGFFEPNYIQIEVHPESTPPPSIVLEKARLTMSKELKEIVGRARTACAATDGYLWLGTGKTVLRQNILTGQIMKVAMPTGTSTARISPHDAYAYIMFYGDGGGLMRINNDGTIRVFSEKGAPQKMPLTVAINGPYLWVAVASGPLLLYNTKADTWEKVLDAPSDGHWTVDLYDGAAYVYGDADSHPGRFTSQAFVCTKRKGSPTHVRKQDKQSIPLYCTEGVQWLSNRGWRGHNWYSAGGLWARSDADDWTYSFGARNGFRMLTSAKPIWEDKKLWLPDCPDVLDAKWSSISEQELVRVSRLLNRSTHECLSDSMLHTRMDRINDVSLVLTSPQHRTSHGWNSVITLSAEVTQTASTITRIDFLSNGRKIGHVSTPPYSIQWQSRLSGEFTITARAYDAMENVWLSNPATIIRKVNSRILTPKHESTVWGKNDIAITLDATDPDGHIDHVALYVDRLTACIRFVGSNNAKKLTPIDLHDNYQK